MSTNSTRPAKARKSGDRPEKPYPDFPLYAHPSGTWAIKIRTKLRYFGRWGRRRKGKMERIEGDGWVAAKELFDAQKEDLYAGRTPRKAQEGELTVGDLRDKFLTAKTNALKAHDITSRTYFEYKATVLYLVERFGERRVVDDLAADDFASLRVEMSERWGPVRLGNEVQKVRTFFKWGYEMGLIKLPMRYGPEFKKPSAKKLRLHRASGGKKMLTAEECRRLIEAAPVPLKAMILLGLNCGYGNHDSATLPLSVLELDRGWIDYARPKTGIERRCPLWPETVVALRAALAERPTPKADATELVFVRSRGRTWLNGGIANPISAATGYLMRRVGVHRPGLGHYTLRHIFRTVADGARDQVAANLIMGHADASMAATYREQIDDARLLAVTNHVRTWLYADGGAA